MMKQKVEKEDRKEKEEKKEREENKYTVLRESFTDRENKASTNFSSPFCAAI